METGVGRDRKKKERYEVERMEEGDRKRKEEGVKGKESGRKNKKNKKEGKKRELLLQS